MMTQKDILICFDDQENNSSNWTELLGKNLKNSIHQLFGEEISFTIGKLNPSDVSKFASVLFILDKENKMAEAFQNAKNISSKKPTFIIYRQLITKSTIQQELPELNSYLFSDIDIETGIERSYSAEGNQHESRLYWAKILDIAFDLGSAIIGQGNTNDIEQTIYLAECSPEQFENRDAIRSELVHRGFKVLPPHFLKGSNDELIKKVSSYLEQSCISVHIVGNHYGEIIIGSDLSLTELQCRLAAKHWRVNSEKLDGKQFQRIVWLPPGLKPSDEHQRRFVATLRTEDKDAYSEIMQVPLEDLKTALREKITNSEQQITVNRQQKKSVYIIYEKKDLDQVHAVKTFLESKNVKANYLDFNSEQENKVSEHFSYLATSDSVLICDFGSSKQWINSKLKDLIKSPGFGRNKPFDAKAIYTNNSKRFKKLEEDSQCMVIAAGNDLEKTLTPILTKINL
jgi:hypothetical protein